MSNEESHKQITVNKQGKTNPIWTIADKIEDVKNLSCHYN